MNELQPGGTIDNLPLVVTAPAEHFSSSQPTNRSSANLPSPKLVVDQREIPPPCNFILVSK